MKLLTIEEHVEKIKQAKPPIMIKHLTDGVGITFDFDNCEISARSVVNNEGKIAEENI